MPIKQWMCRLLGHDWRKVTKIDRGYVIDAKTGEGSYKTTGLKQCRRCKRVEYYED